MSYALFSFVISCDRLQRGRHRRLGGEQPRLLRKALQGDNSEMALGQMAVENGTSLGIRDFGRMLREDHGRAKAVALDR